jgi:PhnB protein
MTQINVYLMFDGNCAEAMSFYQQCLGGELSINKVEGSPLEGQCPPEKKDKIMHASLTNGGIVLMASDVLMPGTFVRGNASSVSLNCSSEEEIQNYFAKLSAGGQVTLPLGKQFWGAVFGMLTDKFGVEWMLNYDQNSQH